MEPFIKHEGVVAPLDRINVDTDQIIPKQFLKRVERTGFGQFLFFDWRLTDGEPNQDFVLNQPRYEDATVLLARDNFGCGSSREHAPWALLDYGFRAALAPSFADIFYNNCFKNGLLPVRLPEDAIAELFARVEAQPGYRVTIDLRDGTVQGSDGYTCEFQVDDFRRQALLRGLDDIGLTLEQEESIAAYEATHDGHWTVEDR